MRSTTSPIRNAGSAVTATALMTLVAIAATVSATPTANAAQVEATAAWMEHSAVRTIAAAVASAARDFLGTDRHTTASSASSDQLDTAPYQPRALMPVIVRVHHGQPLREAMLALPPPAC